MSYQVKAVIFDQDGLMFDTETISIPSWVKAGEILGYPITRSHESLTLFGMNPVGGECLLEGALRGRF